MTDEVIRGYWAGAKFNGDFYCISTRSGYRGGTHMDPKGKQHLLEPDASDEALGLAVKDALAHSRWVLHHPREGITYHPEVEFDTNFTMGNVEPYEIWVKAMMAHYDYKTRRAMFKNMESCSIASKAGILSITPSRHKKLEMWGSTIHDGIEDVIIPDTSTPAEIGAALRLAFIRCQD